MQSLAVESHHTIYPVTKISYLYLKSGIMQSLDIAVNKGIKAVFIYNMLREGVPKSNGTCTQRMHVD